MAKRGVIFKTKVLTGDSILGPWRWRRRQSYGILSERVGFESRDGLVLFSVQNCMSILAGHRTFPK